MKIPMELQLTQFEKHIDHRILIRGSKYFEDGHVHDMQEIEKGKYEATVKGIFDYTVQIGITNEIVKTYDCDCPYDYGPICKHIVAALFYLRKEVLENKPNKPKPIVEQVNEILEQANIFELKEFIQKQIVLEKDIRNSFLINFAQYNPEDTKKFYVGLITSTLKSAANNNGFIDWGGVRYLKPTFENYLASAQTQIAHRNYQSAVFVCTAIIEELNRVMGFSDDSEGHVSTHVFVAFEMLNSIAKKIIQKSFTENIKQLLIDFCFDSLINQNLFYAIWKIKALEIAVVLVEDKKDAIEIFKLIEKEQWPDEVQEEIQTITYTLLQKTENENAVSKYLDKNLINPSLRRKAIQKEIKMNNYEKAIFLAQNGIQCDFNLKPGLVNEWYEFLLQIAQAQNDTEKIIEYARFLLIDGFGKDQYYYQILKQSVKKEQWNNFIEAIIKELTQKDRWFDLEIAASIFIKEKQWDRLLKIVQKSPDFYTLEYYEPYLSKDFPLEIADLYAQAIINFMDNLKGRGYYYNIAEHIKKIIHLGDKKKACEVIAYLEKNHSYRVGLSEELNKISIHDDEESSF